MNEVNYFEILELDPDTDDPALAERRLQEKQRLWSRQAIEGTPRDARLASRNLKLIEDIRTTFADASRRAVMAHKARLRASRRQREARARLSELLEFARDRVEDLELFISKDCARYVRELGRDEVARMAAAAGITSRAPRAGRTTGQTVRRDTLEPTTAKRVREALEHLGKRDLYEFLGLTRRCSAKSLTDKAEQMNKSLLQSGRTDDQTATAKELAGQCLAVFATEDGKTRYNNTLTEDRLEAALADFLMLAGQDSLIDQREFGELLAIAARQGLAASEASTYIHTVAQRRKWLVLADQAATASLAGAPQTAGSEVGHLEPCGYCGCLPRKEDDVFCWNCNRRLTLACPQCGKLLHSSQSTCTDCGTNVEDAEIVEEHFKNAQLALNGGLADEALDHLEACLALWPSWGEAITLRDSLLARRAKQQNLARKLVSLLRERRMFEAQDCLTEWEKVALKNRPGEDDPYARAAELVHKSLNEANRLFAEGEQHRRAGNMQEAGQCYEQALALCSDMQPARDAIRNVPPEPPARLVATPLEQDAVRLVWVPSDPNAPFTHVLTRKENGAPAAPDDGDVLFSSDSATRFDDTSAAGGVAWYYTVFAVRHNVPSARGASAGPVMLTPPASQFNALPGDASVALSWTLPANAMGVTLTRRKELRAEGDPGNASVPVAASRTLAFDSGLENGVTYVYTVYALYADGSRPSGSQASPGLECRVMPMPPLEAVRDLTASQADGRILLTWTPPPAGAVCVLASRSDAVLPPYKVGDTLSPEALEAFGEPVPLTGPGSASVLLDAAETVWQRRVVPLTVLGGMAVLGEACLVTELRDVDEVETVLSKGQPMLRWRWPVGVREVLVCWNGSDDRNDANFPAEPHCACSGRAICHVETYQRDNGFLLTGVSPQKLRLSLFAKAEGQEVYAPGVRHFSTMGVLDVVRYRVLRTGLFGKRATAIELYSDHVDELTDLVLRGKENCVPLTLADGMPLLHVEQVRFRNGVAEIAVPKRYQSSRLYVKLFHAQPERNAAIRLMPAAPDELKLW